jgi:hypothetical protein
MARLKAVNDAVSVLTAILYAADVHMHITTGSGAAQGFPTAGDWMMRIQYATSDPAYNAALEQWEIVRATLRPSTAHGADADTIDITRVSEGADAPTDWPVGSVVYNVNSKEYLEEVQAEVDLKMATADDAAAALAAAVLLGGISDAEVAKAPVHHEVFQALALKAPSSGIALTALANQANLTLDGNISGGAAAPSALTAIQVLNTFLMSIAVADLGTKGAEEVTVDWTLGYNKIVTVNGAADFHMTDPGCTGAPKLSMKITKDNSVTIRTPTFTGAATVVWSGGSSPALDVANGVYEITFHRWTANNYTASWSRFY